MRLAAFLGNRVFEPEQIVAMSAAFEALCRELGLPDRTDAMAEMVARHIIDAAERGVRTKTALYFIAKLELESSPQ